MDSASTEQFLCSPQPSYWTARTTRGFVMNNVEAKIGQRVNEAPNKIKPIYSYLLTVAEQLVENHASKVDNRLLEDNDLY